MKGRMGVLGTTFPRFCAFKIVNYRFQLAGYYPEVTTKQVSALQMLILLMYISTCSQCAFPALLLCRLSDALAVVCA